MTPDILHLLKTKLAMANMNLQRKRLVWAVATFLFVGSLRSGEVLPSNKSVFVKGSTLLNRNVQRVSKEVEGDKVQLLQVMLESPKEDKYGKGVEVELFRIPDSFFCPVTAWRIWRKNSKLSHDDDLPVFRLEDGTGYTQRELNADLRKLLESEIDYEGRKITAHSFRAGITTIMARLGYSQEMISLQGRWKSDAYLAYCKLGRANRLQDQWSLMKEMTRVSTTMISGGVLVS